MIRRAPPETRRLKPAAASMITLRRRESQRWPDKCSGIMVRPFGYPNVRDDMRYLPGIGGAWGGGSAARVARRFRGAWRGGSATTARRLGDHGAHPQTPMVAMADLDATEPSAISDIPLLTRQAG
jgi:hypothetical protein